MHIMHDLISALTSPLLFLLGYFTISEVRQDYFKHLALKEWRERIKLGEHRAHEDDNISGDPSYCGYCGTRLPTPEETIHQAAEQVAHTLANTPAPTPDAPLPVGLER